MSTTEILLIVTLALLILTWVFIIFAAWMIWRRIKTTILAIVGAVRGIELLSKQIRELGKKLPDTKSDSEKRAE